MKKLLLLLTCIILLASTKSYSDTEIYLGVEQNGQVYTGIRTKIKIDDIALVADVRSKHLSKNDYYLAFTPGHIVYYTGIEYKDFGIMHECRHGVDQEDPNKYIKNYIYYRYLF